MITTARTSSDVFYLLKKMIFLFDPIVFYVANSNIPLYVESLLHPKMKVLLYHPVNFFPRTILMISSIGGKSLF